MTQKSNTAPTDILSLLPPERRAELLEEILGAEVRGLIERHRGSTFGRLVEGITAHPAWNHIRDFPLSAVFHVGSPAPAATPAPAPAAPAAPAAVTAAPAAPTKRRSAGKARAKKEAKPKRARKGERPSKVGEAYLEELLNFVRANGGLRSEEIQKRTGGDKARVGAALAELKAQKRVTTSGNARGTTYTAK